jgi:cell division protein FtsQ
MSSEPSQRVTTGVARERTRRHSVGPASPPTPVVVRNRRVVPKPGAATPPPPPPRPRLRDRIARMRARAGEGWTRAKAPLAKAARIALALLLALGSLALARVLERWARHAPELAIRTITIEGEDRLSEAEVLGAAGIALGDNVFARSETEVHDALLGHPWIAEATVARRLPGTFRITIRERVAAAILELEEPYLVSDEGAVFKTLEPGDPVDLPVITGIDRQRFFSERAFRTQILTSIVGLFAEWRALGMEPRESIGEVHVEADDALTLFVGDDGTEVRLGQGPYRGKIERLRRVLDELSSRHTRPLYVYLDNLRRPDRVTVRVR